MSPVTFDLSDEVGPGQFVLGIEESHWYLVGQHVSGVADRIIEITSGGADASIDALGSRVTTANT